MKLGCGRAYMILSARSYLGPVEEVSWRQDVLKTAELTTNIARLFFSPLDSPSE
jgi:hypothetical protein